MHRRSGAEILHERVSAITATQPNP